MSTTVILPNEAVIVVVPDETLGTPIVTSGDVGSTVVLDAQPAMIVLGSEGPAGNAGADARTDLSFSWQGRLIDGEQLPGIMLTFGVTLTDAGSSGYALDASTVDLVLSIKNKTTVIGTVTFESGVNEAVVAFVGGEFNGVSGDVIYLVAPAPADATLSDGAVTLAS